MTTGRGVTFIRQPYHAIINLDMRERIKGIGFVLITLGTLGLILNEFVFESSSTRTIIFAAVDVIGLVCLAYGRFWTRDRTAP